MIRHPRCYQPNASQRTCGVVGLRRLDRSSKNFIHNFVALRGFQHIDLERLDAASDLTFEKYEHLATLDVALEFVDFTHGAICLLGRGTQCRRRSPHRNYGEPKLSFQ